MENSANMENYVELVDISVNVNGNDVLLTVDAETAETLLNDHDQARKYVEMAFPEANDNCTDENNSSTFEELCCVPEKKKVWFSKGRPTAEDEAATATLLELRKNYDPKFRDKKSTNNSLWAAIAKELEAKGYDICPTKEGPAAKCRQKYVNLEKQYTTYIQHTRRTGEEKKCKPPYFNELHAILENKHKMYPTSLQDSEGSEPVAGPSHQISDTEDSQEDNNNVNERVINRFAKTKRTVRPKSRSSEIITTFTEQQALDREDRRQQYQALNKLLQEQNEQRREMIGLFSTLVRHHIPSIGVTGRFSRMITR
ncbi:uncharacterized protein LOC135125855 isoform X2 [Zophobas morio]|uniref:uncharacterized protein LOC135125855 isoform X2 n=1 Tax=Zophobas morio TaxID=2755281 RepID=UPI003083D839